MPMRSTPLARTAAHARSDRHSRHADGAAAPNSASAVITRRIVFEIRLLCTPISLSPELFETMSSSVDYMGHAPRLQCTTTSVPIGAQRYSHAAFTVGRLTQPWLIGRPKLACQYVP